MSFHTLGLGPKLLQSIADAGYTTPTAIQNSAIPHINSGRDLIGIAQTGTGKTAAFALPIIERLAAIPQHGRGPRALVVAPTRELAAQIDEAIRTLGRRHHIRCATVFGDWGGCCGAGGGVTGCASVASFFFCGIIPARVSASILSTSSLGFIAVFLAPLGAPLSSSRRSPKISFEVRPPAVAGAEARTPSICCTLPRNSISE